MSRLILLLSVIVAAAAPSAAASESGLTPVHPRPAQVSGCKLVGKIFGTLEAGGAVIFKGERYEVSESHAKPDRIIYSGPKIRAVFTPRHGRAVVEGDSGMPNGAGPDVPGTLSIEIAGSVITTNAREHCVLFE